VLNDLLRIGGYDLLANGGHDYEVPEFLQQLPRELRARVGGTFSVDPGTASRAGICGIAGAIAARYERERDSANAEWRRPHPGQAIPLCR
jgi:hypothetical protein